MREDMEASWKPSATTTTSTSTMTTIFGLEEKKHLRDKIYARRFRR
jgi:hypothetical protein